MPLVGAGLGGHGDDAAGAVPGFGIHAVLRNDDFLDGIHVRRVTELVAQADRAAIDLQIVLQVGFPAQIHAVRGPGQERQHLPACIDRFRCKQSQLERIAVEARSLGCHGGIDGQILVAGVELHRHGGFRDRDALLHAHLVAERR